MIHVEKYKSGNKIQGIGYKYFMPEKINDGWTWTDSKLNTLLSKASYELGQLNSFAKLVPNIDLFIHLHIVYSAPS